MQDKNWTPAIITHLSRCGQFLNNIHPKTIQRWQDLPEPKLLISISQLRCDFTTYSGL